MTDFTFISDEKLVSLCIDGNSDAWTVFFERYKSTVEIIARSFNVSNSAYDDLLSDGIANGLLKAIATFKTQKAGFSTYASVCIRHAMENTIKKAKSAGRVPVEKCLPVDEATQLSVTSNEAKAELKEITDSFETLLTDREREVFVLHLMGYNNREIARKLSLTERIVGTDIQKAQTKIRGAFAGE